MADFDLADAYDEISAASSSHLLNITGLSLKIQLEKELGDLLRLQSKTNNELNDIPYDYNRNWNLLTKTGNYLLPKEEYEMLVDFANANEELYQHSKVSMLSGSSTVNIDKQSYLNALATERNLTVLSTLWSTWQNIFYPHKEHFFSVLHLLNDSYLVNEEESVKTYWEMLSEYDDGYQKAQDLWEKVEPLYKKMHEFVKLRICSYYGLKEDDSIPVYLLGSNFGNDWSTIADIVLPNIYLYSEVNQKLKEQSVKDVYKLAERMTEKINLGSLGKQFWKKSNFNFSFCGPYIFSYSEKKYTEIITCNKLDFTKFMDIHETAMNVALRNQDYASLARMSMRYSAVDEALQGLGSLMAIHSLPVYGLIPEDVWTNKFDEHSIRNSALLILALRVLPKLPYYLLADTWRLEELEISERNFTANWWLNRRQIQRVHGNTNNEVDFLGDSFISSNKPYLSKFLGIFLQFQLFDYYNKYYVTENGSIIDFIKQDDNFIKFIKDRPNKSWMEMLNFNYNIDKISPDALLEYFEPLEYYLEELIFEIRTTKLSAKELSTSQSDDDVTYSNTESVLFNVTQPAPAESTPFKASYEKIWILLGSGGLILCALIIFVFVRKLRKKRKTNNRRFET